MIFDFHNTKTGVALVGFNRLDYFEEVLVSVAPQLENRPLHVFLDIGRDGDTANQERHKKLTKTLCPEAQVIMYKSHLGCNASMVKCRQWMFEHLRYPRAHILEDDCVLSDGHFQLCESIMDWTDQHYSNVGWVQLWSGRDGHNKQDESPFKLRECHDHQWQYLQKKTSWDAISDMMAMYLDFFFSCKDYNTEQNLIKVLKWKENIVQTWLSNKQIPIQDGFPTDNQQGLTDLKNANPIHDAITANLLFLTNQVRVCPIVGRTKAIGARGTHFTPEHFAHKGLTRSVLYSHPEDYTRKQFSV